MPQYFNSIQEAISVVEESPNVTDEDFRVRSLTKLYDWLEVEDEFESIFNLRLSRFVPIYSQLFATFDYLGFARDAIGQVEDGVSYNQRTRELFGDRGADLVTFLVSGKKED